MIEPTDIGDIKGQLKIFILNTLKESGKILKRVRNAKEILVLQKL